MGNVGAEPEIRSFQDGGRVANLRIAVSEKFTARDGQQKETTEWIPLVVNGKLVDVVANYIHKGTSIYVQGKWRTREWTDQQNVKHYQTELNVFQIQLLGPKPANGQQAYPQQGGYAQPQGSYPQQGYAQPGYPPQGQPAYPPQGQPAYPPQGQPAYPPQVDDLPAGF